MRTSLLIAALVVILNLSFPAAAEAANCFCKFTANPYGKPKVEVLKLQESGYTQGLEKGKCKTYCQGQFDARDKKQLAELYPNGCGFIYLEAYAAIGTAPYDCVRGCSGGGFDVGGTWGCPSGQWLHTDGKSCVTGAGCKVAGIPNQDLKGGYFFWQGDLFKITGPATCKK